MPGVVGGTVNRKEIDAMATSLEHEDWYETERLLGFGYGLASVNHGERDPDGHTVWRGDGAVGVLHGAITNADELRQSTDEIFQAVVNRPQAVLPKLDGPFLLACANRDGTIIVATDKLGTRPCFYTTDGGFAFGTELKAVLPQLDEVAVNKQAVSDMLLMGYVIGRKSLVEGVQTLPPATYLEYDDGDVSLNHYWTPEFGTAPKQNYVEETVSRYRDAVGKAADTIEGRAGIWLSSGLDSRTLAVALDEATDSLEAFTYDTNWGKDCPGAKQVAEALHVPHHVCEYEADDCLHSIQKGVDIVDGMHQWSYYVNLPPAEKDVPESIDVLFEASGQGEFFGDVMNLHYLKEKSPVEALYSLKKQVSSSKVQALLANDVDPKATFENILDDSLHQKREHRVLDANWRIYSNAHFRGNKLYRSQAGTRVPYADGRFINHIAKMPVETYRQRTLPFTDGKAPYGVAPLKLEVMREVGAEVCDIPYDRTGLTPSSPLSLQAGGFVLQQVKERLFGSQDTKQAEWYRHDSELSAFLDGLLDAACENPLFEGDAIRDVQQAHLDAGVDNVRLLSAITTVQLWKQRYVDQEYEPTSRPVSASTLD
jgi:asparagine synthase (glutamine-hydrolysing)